MTDHEVMNCANKLQKVIDAKKAYIEAQGEYKQVALKAGVSENCIRQVLYGSAGNDIKSNDIIHEIKTDTLYFQQSMKGIKDFELRLDDRDYQIGDKLLMIEYLEGVPTGNRLYRQIISKLEGYKGLEEGYCILGVK